MFTRCFEVGYKNGFKLIYTKDRASDTKLLDIEILTCENNYFFYIINLQIQIWIVYID